MRKPYNENIKNTLNLANEMICLAEKGSSDRFDHGCGILYGVLLDSAFKIKKIAEAEKEAHIKKDGGNRLKLGFKKCADPSIVYLKYL